MKAEIIRNGLMRCDNCKHNDVLNPKCTHCVTDDGDIKNFELNEQMESCLEELERLATIGRYTEMAFEQGGFIEVDVLIDPNDDESAQTCIIDTENRLIVWGKKQEANND